MSAGDGLASVIIRTLNEEAKLGEVLTALRAQTYQRFEVLVVDSGSTDRTVEIARAFSARVHSIPRESFTYGYALNYGCQRAAGEYLIALSGHTIPWFPGWLARLLDHLAAPDIAASTGGGFSAGDDYATRRLRTVRIDARNYLAEPTWGLNNAAAAFRAELWRRHPFDEKLPYCEDLEWGWCWMKRGYALIWDEACSVIHEHREPLRQQYSRSLRLGAGLAAILPGSPLGQARGLSEWLVDPLKASLLALLHGYAPTRAAKLWGKYRGLNRPSPASYALEPEAAVPAAERFDYGDCTPWHRLLPQTGATPR
jgi:GT2 family glycosyltransferase